MRRSFGVFKEWVDKTYPSGVHYSDICSFCRRAFSCGLDLNEAEEFFASIYVGNSKWRPNFRKVFNNER